MEVKLPELGEGIEEATVTYWQKELDAEVNEGEDLVEMSTDKAVFNVPAPQAGTLKQILKEEGDTVKVGEVLAIIE